MNLVILVVDDCDSTRLLLSHEFRKISDSVFLAEDLGEAMRVVREEPRLHIVTMDIGMPGCSAEEVFASVGEIRRLHPHCAVVVLTGDPDAQANGLYELPDMFLVKSGVADNATFFCAILQALHSRAAGNDDLREHIRELTDKLYPAAQPA